LAALVGICAASDAAWSQGYLAQSAGRFTEQKAVGFGFYYGVGVVNFEAPPSNASNEVKGYTDALPTSVLGTGLSVGISYGRWGLIVGANDDQGKINKYADVNQTPNNSADDVFVLSAHRINSSLTLVFQPVRYLFLGLGQNTGSISFDQINPNGTQTTRRVGYQNDFYSVGLAFGFNPESTNTGPVLAVFTEHPFAPGVFNGTINAVAVGWYF
jgi:hypothetical protein